ncbi:unnamed protein product (macronuclear) [Paramecium tetraurelia]|uniref:Transmembrane protein n=1 Tax=Paramecium tetraurelia TaxID=5888 RepID=A0C669_PARTE|nr:uncharacterized protein GSPATT00035415001 [Paramecium tetraurelia]CAK66286.1 unnamed protein product [Paramecium tetraurelia]|eukprot:XP_001433683.1 hypothetical protein (macronuclear) [Paramecium tetraurelia strain d4-2]
MVLIHLIAQHLIQPIDNSYYLIMFVQLGIMILDNQNVQVIIINIRRIPLFLLILCSLFFRSSFQAVKRQYMTNQELISVKNVHINIKLFELMQKIFQVVYQIPFAFLVQSWVVIVQVNTLTKQMKNFFKMSFQMQNCYGQDDNNCVSCDFIANRELKKMNAYVNHIILKWKFRNAQVILDAKSSLQCIFCYEFINSFDNCTSCNSDIQLVGNIDYYQFMIKHVDIVDQISLQWLVKCESIQQKSSLECHLSCRTYGGIDEGNCLHLQILILDTKQEMLLFVKQQILMQNYLFVRLQILMNAIGYLKAVFLVWIQMFCYQQIKQLKHITNKDHLYQVLIDANAFEDIMMMDKMKFVKNAITHVLDVANLIPNVNYVYVSQIQFIMIKTYLVIVILDIMIMGLKIVKIPLFMFKLQLGSFQFLHFMCCYEQLKQSLLQQYLQMFIWLLR